MARRDLRRHRVRSLLTAVLVALPVMVAVLTALFTANTGWQGESQARSLMGAADARVTVTRFAAVDVAYNEYGDVQTRPASFTRTEEGRTPLTRDRDDVDVLSLLPEGSRVLPAPEYGDARLATGGRVGVLHAEADDPMLVGLVELGVGRAPSAPDETAVSREMADVLGFLHGSGVLRDDAVVDLADGTDLRVVGLVDVDRTSAISSTGLLVPFDSAAGSREPKSLLVDLPELAGPELRALTRSLAEAGVAMLPRDVVLTPQDWVETVNPPAPVDVTSVAVGALAILIGLAEVVLVVGAAFAVSARRRVRDLGLLAASGGAAVDVRRVLLAQGLVLGALASVVGALLAVLLFPSLVPVFETVTDTRVWTQDVDLVTVGLLTLLGSVTGVVAAFVPAWSISRLTPVAALSGRFPMRPGEATAHRPAFVLAGFGLTLLALGGWWSSVEFAPQEVSSDVYYAPSALPVVLAGFGLLLLIAGVVWSTPYVVRRVGSLGRALPLSGRFAFRDAMRHRMRSAAAAIALGITVAGAALTGFGVTSAAAAQKVDGWQPAQSVRLWSIPSEAREPELYQAYRGVLDDVFGDYTLVETAVVAAPRDGEQDDWVEVVDRDVRASVRAVDPAALRELVHPDDVDAAVATLTGGGVVVTTGPEREAASVAVLPRKRNPDRKWTLPAVRVDAAAGQQDWHYAWVSPQTATSLGLVLDGADALVKVGREVTQRDLTALAVAGLEGGTQDVQVAQLRLFAWGATAATALVTLLVAGMAVALAAAESRSDAATFAAVGAGPRRRRGLGAMHGLFLGLVGTLVGLVIAVPAGLSLTQIDGLAGVVVPWSTLLATAVVAPLFAAVAGWVVTPTRLTLVRRTA